MSSRIILLEPGERIVAVVPEPCGGPGWATFPVWVYIANGTTLRSECLQPEEQSEILWALYYAGEAMQLALVAAVPTQHSRANTSEEVDNANE